VPAEEGEGHLGGAEADLGAGAGEGEFAGECFGGGGQGDPDGADGFIGGAAGGAGEAGGGEGEVGLGEAFGVLGHARATGSETAPWAARRSSGMASS